MMKEILKRVSIHLHELVYAYVLLMIMTQAAKVNGWLVEKWSDVAINISDFVVGNPITNVITMLLCVLLVASFWYIIVNRGKANFIRLVTLFAVFYLVCQSEEQYWRDTILDGISYKGMIAAMFASSFMLDLPLWLDSTPLVSKRKKTGKLAEKEDKGLSTISKNDELQKTGREVMAEVLLTKLLKTDVQEENYAVGISSGWGTGKTTFLKHIKEIGKDDFEITEFFPWDCGSPDKIIQELFSTLSNKLDKGGTVRKQMLAYATMLSEIAEIPYSDKIKGVLGLVNNQSSLKKLVKDGLKKEHKKHLILVDDIDRLDSDELFEVLRLVRVTANFPNIIFIVTYDREHILEMLVDRNIKNAELYIKKIFHLELVLPEFEPYALPQMLYDEIKRMTNDEEILKQIWDSVFWINPNKEYGITRYIRNFRDVKRFASVFAVHISRIIAEGSLNDVSIFDLFWLDVLAYYDYGVFESLRDNPYDILGGSGENGNFLALKKEYTEDDGNTKVKLKPYTNIILRTLFRGKANIIGSNNIAVKDNYQTYFSFRVHDNKIGYNEFHQTLLKAKEKDIPRIVRAWCEGDVLSKKESLFAHLSISQEVHARDIRVKNNFFAMMMAAVPYCDEMRIQDIFHRFMSGSASKMVHDKYLDAIMKVIENTEDYMIWNKIIASLYSYEAYDYDEGITRDKYQSIFTDQEVIAMAQQNWNNFIKGNGMPRVEELTTYGTKANTFLKDACVESSFNLVDNEEDRTSLIVDKLIADYAHQYSSDFREFINPFDLSDDDYATGFDAEISEGIRTKIKKLFGNINKYKEFINSTFKGGEEDKEKYYKRIGI